MILIRINFIIEKNIKRKKTKSNISITEIQTHTPVENTENKKNT